MMKILFFPFRASFARLKKGLFLSALILFYPHFSLMAMSKLACFGAAVAEAYVPGLGYTLTGQLDKAAIFGGARWAAGFKIGEAMDSPYFQETAEDIYLVEKGDPVNGVPDQTWVYLNQETWNYQFYATISQNMLFTAWGDMYRNRCKSGGDTYEMMAAPLDVGHWANKWEFWAPIALVVYSAMNYEKFNKTEYHLGNGLTEKQIRQDSFPMFYMVGVGEEMLFRGTFQHAFFDLYQESFNMSPHASRLGAILSGAAVFGAAHSGNGFSANAGQAFLAGIYFGYLYQPDPDNFDLKTAIAVHAWWDLIITYAILNSATFIEEDTPVAVPLVNIAFNF